MKINVKEILVPTGVLFIICVVAAVALALTNELTMEKTKKLKIENANKSMATVLKADEYNKKLVAGDNEKSTFFEAVKGGEVVGYVVSASKKGYGGDVNVMVGIDNSGSITAIDIVSCDDETPGLGQNIKSKDFTNQFTKKSGTVESGEDVDAITGATISSNAVIGAVNEALSLYQSYIK